MSKVPNLYAIQCRNRSSFGTSITEMLVSVVVMGIAFAGISEAALLNSAWSNLVQHKMDNQFSCRRFLARFVNDIHSANYVKSGTETTLELVLPEKKVVSYELISDPQMPEGYTLTRNGTAILSGIIGPKSNEFGTISIFHYVDWSDSSAWNDAKLTGKTANNCTVAVLIDLDLASNNFASNRGAFGGLILKKSAYSIHREVFLRNSNIHG